MNKIFFSAIILLVAPFIVAAQQFTVTPFTGVEATGMFTIHLSQGENHEVTIDADQRILPNVSVEVVGDMLVLRDVGTARNITRIEARITAPYFMKLQAGDLVSFSSEQPLRSPLLYLDGRNASRFDLQVETEKLTTNLSGASRASLQGIATVHSAILSGSAKVDALNLETVSTEVDISGASNASVLAATIISGRASGASQLTIKGNPVLQNIELSGMASVENLNDDHEPISQAESKTERVRVGPVEIRINEDDDVEVERRRSNRQFRSNWTGFELGINGYLTPAHNLTMPFGHEPFELRYERSIAVNLNLFQQNLNLFRYRLGLFTGIGIGWNNYRFGNEKVLIKGSHSVDFVPVDVQGMRQNRLTVTWLNVPFMMEYQGGGHRGRKTFYLSAGLNVGARIGSYSKQVYFPNNDREKRRTRDDFFLNPFRYDLQARVGIGSVGLFASYSLNGLFRDNRGPQLHPFSVGVLLVNF